MKITGVETWWTQIPFDMGGKPKVLGGLNWQAGFVGGSIGAWLIARRHSSPMLILDLLAIGTALGACFGWIGSYLSVTAYGKELYPGQPFFFHQASTANLG